MVVVRTLDHKVSVEMVVRKFHLGGGLKGEMVSFSLEQGNLLFHFKAIGERDLILYQS